MPSRKTDGDTPHTHGGKRARPDRASHPGASRWVAWASLLHRVFGLDSWACPHCEQRMRLRTVVCPPATIDVLTGLHAAARAPPTTTSAVS